MNKALMSSVRQDWNTPPEFLELVRKVGPIKLDPCTTDANPCEAADWMDGLIPEADGLTCDWRVLSGGGLCYVNPPYGRSLPEWASKISNEGMRGCEIISLTPARTDTRWFRNMVTADAMCFWSGRIKFVGAKHSAPFPSLVCYWGRRCDRFREVFRPHGWCPL